MIGIHGNITEIYNIYIWNTYGRVCSGRYSSVTWNIWHVLFLHKKLTNRVDKLCLCRKWAACQRMGKTFVWRPLLGALWLAEMRLRGARRWVQGISKFEALSYLCWLKDFAGSRIRDQYLLIHNPLYFFLWIGFLCSQFILMTLDLQMCYPFRLQILRLFAFLCGQLFLEEWKLLIASDLLAQAGVRLPPPANLRRVRWHQLVFGHASFRKLRWNCELLWTQRIGDEGFLPGGCGVVVNSNALAGSKPQGLWYNGRLEEINEKALSSTSSCMLFRQIFLYYVYIQYTDIQYTVILFGKCFILFLFWLDSGLARRGGDMCIRSNNLSGSNIFSACSRPCTLLLSLLLLLLLVVPWLPSSSFLWDPRLYCKGSLGMAKKHVFFYWSWSTLDPSFDF